MIGMLIVQGFGQKVIKQVIVFSVGSRKHYRILLVVIFLVVLTVLLLIHTVHYKEMLAKILMYPCYAELFESNEENKYIKKLAHFYCKCDDEHKYFV